MNHFLCLARVHKFSFLLFVIFSLVVTELKSFSQTKRIIFEHFSVNNGLINDEIDHIYMDSEGFVWFASATGLQHYDGFTFRKFQFNADDSTSISDNFITTIAEDDSGNLWIGTFSRGLEVYDKRLDVFYHLEDLEKGMGWLSSDYIPKGKNVITTDKYDYLWLNSFDCLHRIDLSNYTINKFYNDFEGKIVYDSLHHILWIADDYLKKFELNGEILSTYKASDNQIAFTQINAIIIDANNDIWLGTDKGIFLFDPIRNNYYDIDEYFSKKGIQISDNFSWSSSEINALYEDYLGRIWIGVQDSLYVINKNTGSYQYYTHEIDNHNSLLDEEVKEIYGNKKGVIWISYVTRGVSKVIINTKKFSAYRHIPRDKNSLSGYKVRSVFKGKNQDLWVGTFNDGLNQIPKTDERRIIRYQHDPDDRSTINSDYVTAIYIDSKDRLWVGFFNNGFCYADQIYQSTNIKFNRVFNEEYFEVHEFLEDPFGRIWICTLDGFYIYDHRIDNFVQYGSHEMQVPEVADINIQSAVFDPPNAIWMATWNRGLCKLEVNSDSLLNKNPTQDNLTVFDNMRTEKFSSIDPRFITMLKYQENVIWLGSNVDGLVKMKRSPDGIAFKKYDVSRGAPGNSVYGIANDRHGNIWISTNNGIGKFNPVSEEFMNYTESDGLLSNAFTWDASYKADNGEIFFGNSNGVNSFFADSIRDNNINSHVFLSTLIINNKEVSINEKVNGHIIINKSLRFTDKILLSHKIHAFSLEFTALDYGNPKEIQFRYRLEGFEDEWIYTNVEKRYVTYTNLPPGEYTFRVQGTNSDGIWNNEEVILGVEITKAPWKTFWAYGIYIIVFIVLLYLFSWEIMRWSKIKNDLAIEHVRHEKDNELNRHKVQFFTNMAHELRTPLTLILGPLQRMIRHNDGNNRVQQNLLLIERNVNRLLKLTSQIMDFQKFESGKLKLKAAEGNLVQFLNEICIAFRHHSFRKEIIFNFISREQEIKTWYDRDKLEIIIFNLLSNAMKFTPPKGKVTISLEVKSRIDIKELELGFDDKHYTSFGEISAEIKEVVEVKIVDNGCGVSQEHLSQIFNRFYRTENTFIGGTGIGLEIVKNNVELHRGKIGVFSLVDKGTNFFVWLPKGKIHLKKDELLLDFKNSEHTDHYKFVREVPPSKKQLSGQENVLIRKNKNGSRPSILVADDNPEILVFLKEIFQTNYHVYTAFDGNDAIRLAFEVIPDLIISDIMMPGIDGLELCRQCKEDLKTSHIPIILLTARTSLIFKSEGYEIGADDYINKPFNPDLLESRVKNLIQSRLKLRKKYGNDINLTPKDITLNSSDEKFLERLINYIEEHIAESDLKIENIAKALGLSHSLLYKKLTALTNLSVIEFISTVRLKKAAALLTHSQCTISQAAYEVGFSDPKYFSKCFHAFFKITPSDFVEKHRI